MNDPFQVLRWFLAALSLMFIGLKLGGIIEWSWIWVLAPLWVPPAVSLGLYCLGGLLVVVSRLLESHESRQLRRVRDALTEYARRLGKE